MFIDNKRSIFKYIVVVCSIALLMDTLIRISNDTPVDNTIVAKGLNINKIGIPILKLSEH